MRQLTLERPRNDLVWVVAVVGAALLAGPLAVRAPFLLAAMLFGGLLLAAVFVRPLLVLGVVLMLGPVDLSFMTGGTRGLFASVGGLDMNGVRLVGVCAGLGATVLALPATRAVLLGWRGALYALFLLWSAFTLAWSANLLDGLRLWLHMAYPLLVFVTVVGLTERREQVDRLVDFALIGAALVVFLLNPIYAMAGGYEVYQGGFTRVRGVGTHENPLSFYLVVALYMAFTRMVLRRQWRYLLLTAGIGFWLALTLSRITFVAALVGLAAIGLYALMTMRNPRVLLAAAAAGLFLAVALVPIMIERTFGFNASFGELIALMRSPIGLYESIDWQGRELAWPIVFAAFLNAPWTGLGLGSSIVIMRQYFPPEVGPLVHNDYLRVAVETGVIGVVLFTGALMAWLVTVLRADRRSGGTAREYALPGLAALLSWGTIAITDNALNAAPFTQSVALLVGASAACVAIRRREAAT